jgi:Bacteriocin-protection, YdeI or OmpD-Associated
MANAVPKKMRIKENYVLRTLNAPADFKKNLEPLPVGLKVSPTAKDYDQVHWFVRNKKQMEEELNKVLALIKSDVVCWTYYPKGSSGIQTDLTRDKGWDSLLKINTLQWISLISFDQTWSAFGFRLKTAADNKKKLTENHRPILDYLDAEKKIVRLPEEFAASLNKNKKAEKFFQSLSFSNKKEYVEWIVTAKREETKIERLKGSIDRLVKGWKNPRNM